MPYTRHGHWVGPGEPTGPAPEPVARCGGPGICAECNQDAATAGFYGATGEAQQAVCPACGHTFHPKEGAVRTTEAVEIADVTESWDASKHPRAAKGSASGGQFAPMSYSAKKNTGTGYNRKSGDVNVKRLQRALNRLKITDSHGKPLEVDGKLGPLTTSSVIKAKKLLGIKPANGKVTPDFLGKLTGARKLPEHGKSASHKTPKGKTTPKTAPKKPAKGKAPVKPVVKPKPTTGRKPPVEVHLNEAGDAKKPYGQVAYADPGYQADGKARYPVDTEAHVRSAWSYVNQSKNAAKYTADQLKKVKAKIRAAAKRLGIQTTESAQAAVEAHVNGTMSFDDIRQAVGTALEKRVVAETGKAYVWCYVADLTTTDVVYACGTDDLFQCEYSIGENGEVTLGEPEPVVRTYMPLTAGADDMGDAADAEPATMAEAGEVEDSDRIDGRVIEAKGTDGDGGRVFRMRIIAYGDSKNRRRYPESVMRTAVPMYEGSRAYDHHRTEEELRSSTINGLVGSYRNVEAEADGVYGDLHLLPGAAHAAEALDMTIAAQAEGLPPVIGVSHDVMATYKPLVTGGKRMQEATSIVKVNSADLVADPAAGGKATRMVAGGEEDEQDQAEQAESEATESGTVPAENEEDDVPPTKDDILGALAEASDEELARVGLSRAQESDETEETEVVAEAEVTPEAVTEAAQPKTHWLVKQMIRAKVDDAGLPTAALESVTAALPDRVTEGDVDAQISAIKAGLGIVERAGLAPTTTVQVTQEAIDKKKAALDAFFAGKFNEGYYSFKQAYQDFTGKQPRGFTEDFNRVMLRESLGAYDSAVRGTESMDSTTWNLVLGDSITRRMVAEYSQPSLQTWRSIVSSVVPVNDFRTQRIDRVGGYGTLPAVNQSAPYQPLTSPANEEVTYAITKRGGTEDITLEMIANDDVRAISNIPKKLGMAAAQTLYRFVWDLIRTNPTIYDGVALFHANHGNLAGADAALGQSSLSAARVAMRQQTAYGDTSDVLSIVPKTLVVPSVYEEIAYQLTRSAVAVPSTPAGPSDTPNIHAGSEFIVVDYFDSSATGNWFLVCDPNQCPTIEIGFYQGRQTPELFTQSDQSVGSMFDRDAVTYKIRHVYSGNVLDFRGFYRTGIP